MDSTTEVLMCPLDPHLLVSPKQRPECQVEQPLYTGVILKFGGKKPGLLYDEVFEVLSLKETLPQPL